MVLPLLLKEVGRRVVALMTYCREAVHMNELFNALVKAETRFRRVPSHLYAYALPGAKIEPRRCHQFRGV